MRGALFGDQVEAYKDVLVHKGEYEIADVPIRPSDHQWKRNKEELDFQMSLGRQAVVQSLNPEAGPIFPDYRCLASVPRVGDLDNRYDVLGVVLYVEEEAREIKTGQDRVALVREIVITDHRHTDVPVGKAYTCTNCSQKGSMACPRVTTNCDISDSTGTRLVTMFTSESETLLRMPAEDIFRIKHTICSLHFATTLCFFLCKDDIAIKAATEMVRTKSVLVQLSPTVALSKSNALQWCHKKVALEENTEEASEENDQAALEASQENDQADLENTVAPKK
ncbi:hypothetical protein SOVF_106610 [Spinacia oleracea]|nr:hypothetical protein SOVF_106610 [Spinacia oleracea]